MPDARYQLWVHSRNDVSLLGATKSIYLSTEHPRYQKIIEWGPEWCVFYRDTITKVTYPEHRRDEAGRLNQSVDLTELRTLLKRKYGVMRTPI